MRNLYTVTASPKSPLVEPPPPLQVVAPTGTSAIRKAQANLYGKQSAAPLRLEWEAEEIASNVLI